MQQMNFFICLLVFGDAQIYTGLVMFLVSSVLSLIAFALQFVVLIRGLSNLFHKFQIKNLSDPLTVSRPV